MAGACPNCDQELLDEHAFCPRCGQAVIVEDTMGAFLSHFLSDYFAFDSKIGRSMRPLVLKPGFLTNEFAVGRRVRYIPPLRMFIFLSLFFFVVLGLTSGSGAVVDPDRLQEQVFWDRFFGSVLPKMVFLFMPCLAGIIHLFYRRKGTFLIAFVASMHFHAFVFLVFGVYGLISKLFQLGGAIAVNQWLISALCAYTLFYLWRSLLAIFKEPPWMNTLKFLGTVVVYLLLLVAASVLTVYLLS